MRSFVYGCLFSAALLACSSSNNNGPVCGDGVIEGNEQCDDGAANGTSGSSCTSVCTVVVAQPVCGDGHVDPGEQCDEGSQNGAAGSHCTATCTGLAYITAHWSIDCIAAGPTCTGGCPVGYDTAEVVSQKVDSTGNPIGSPKIDLFNCTDPMGITSALTPGTYQEYVAITTHDGSMTYAQSLLSDIDITTQDGTFTDHIYDNGGYLHWAWTLRGGATNNVLTCAQAGAQDVDLLATYNTNAMGYDDLFTCTDGAGTTNGLPAGTYTVGVSALDSNMTPISVTNDINNVTVLDKNQVNDLGNVTLAIIGK